MGTWNASYDFLSLYDPPQRDGSCYGGAAMVGQCYFRVFKACFEVSDRLILSFV